MIKLPSGIEQIWQHWNLPLVLLLLSQENGHTKQLPKQSQGQCSPAALLWLLLLIMHKFFELSRSYGFPDVLVSLACLRWSLPLLIWSYVITITTATWQQTESPKASGAAHHRAERIIHGNVYLCNTHTASCVTKGQGRVPQPHSVATCNQQKPSSWRYSSGNAWREDGAKLIPCCLPPTAGKRVTISLQLPLHNWGLNPDLSYFRSQMELKHFSLHKAICHHQGVCVGRCVR